MYWGSHPSEFLAAAVVESGAAATAVNLDASSYVLVRTFPSTCSSKILGDFRQLLLFGVGMGLVVT